MNHYFYTEHIVIKDHLLSKVFNKCRRCLALELVVIFNLSPLVIECDSPALAARQQRLCQDTLPLLQTPLLQNLTEKSWPGLLLFQNTRAGLSKGWNPSPLLLPLGVGTQQRATFWTCVCWCSGRATTAPVLWCWVASWPTVSAQWGGLLAATSCWSQGNMLCCAVPSTTGRAPTQTGQVRAWLFWKVDADTADFVSIYVLKELLSEWKSLWNSIPICYSGQ